MTCETALDAQLEADLRELKARRGSPLARHLAHCDRCRGRARLIVRETEGLDRALDRVAEAGSTGEAVTDRRAARRALAAARQREASTSGAEELRDGTEGEGSRAGRRGWWRWGAPLAAAAVLVALVLVADPPPPRGGWEQTVGPEADTEPPAPTVEPGTSGTVAVFETSDPDITVVWFFEQEGS